MTIDTLPINPSDAIGLVVQLKDDVSQHTINNFGKDSNYLMMFSEDEALSNIPLERKVRLYLMDDNGCPTDKVHSLAFIMGYNKLRDIFKVIGKY